LRDVLLSPASPGENGPRETAIVTAWRTAYVPMRQAVCISNPVEHIYGVRSSTLLFYRALMRISGVALGMVFLVLLPAGAICRENPHVCAEFFRSDAVFVGTVVSIRDLPDPEDSDTTGGFFYQLKIATMYRGPSQDTVEVYTGNDSARFPLKLHHSYLLFASNFERPLTIGCGGNSAELAEAGPALRSIERLLKTMNSATGGDIWGQVGTSNQGLCEGIRVCLSPPRGKHKRIRHARTATGVSVFMFHRESMRFTPPLRNGRSLLMTFPMIIHTVSQWSKAGAQN
jgi:hypothetical protein